MIILHALSWYLVISLAGWIAFPLAYRLFAFLPDRGLALARPVGLLVWGYVYWLLVSFGILQNDGGGVLFSLLLLGGLSAFMLMNGLLYEMKDWLREHKRLFFSVEAVFLAAFIAWAVVRAAVPDASGTEKPMELAFINAILRSPAFPPSDPWLSGYSISYYYFGYVMVSMLARLAGVPGAVAFNLAVAAWFSLTALAAYGLIYNLLSLRFHSGVKNNLLASLLGPFMILVAGNFDGLLEMLHARGLFWQNLTEGTATSRFWSWLDIQELTRPPNLPLGWQPERTAGIWWWRASRVLQDYALDGSNREVIDEFPMFSYLLGDLHPHILAMPFALLAVGLALNVYLMVRSLPTARLTIRDWVSRLDFWAAALVLGGLAFLNTWDFPIYLALFAAAAVLPRLITRGWQVGILTDFILLAVLLGVAGGVLYLPFYTTFASQANGILPSLIFFTRGIHFWVMFGIQLLPVVFWLVWSLRQRGSRRGIVQGFAFAFTLTAILWLFSYVFGFLRLTTQPGLAGIWGASDPGDLLAESFRRRLASPGTWLTLFGLLGLSGGLLQAFVCSNREIATQESSDIRDHAHPDPFIVLVFILGLGLVLFPEFFYLRDQFGYRMNTIFKFYFQAWILWGLAASYAIVVLLRELRGAWALVFRVGVVIILLISLPYAFFGVLSRTNQLNPSTWTLDGANTISQYNPGEMEAILWLQNAPYGTVAEAVGGSYTGYARVSTHSGLPTILGWPGHESQWRGGAEEIGSREADVQQLYRARNWEKVREILDRYQIRYIFVGPTEVRDFRPDIALFQRNLPIAFQNNDVIIFENPSYNIPSEQADQP